MEAMTATVIYLDPGPQEGRDSALCRQVDPEIFFPDAGDHAVDAKRVCALCPVPEACLADVLRRPSWADQYGIRGGFSPRERDKIRKRDAS